MSSQSAGYTIILSCCGLDLGLSMILATTLYTAAAELQIGM